MKYIIFGGKDNPTALETVILFDESTSHDEMADAIQFKWPGLVPVSAGFSRVLRYDDQGAILSASQGSYTLKLDSRPGDAEILTRFFNR